MKKFLLAIIAFCGFMTMSAQSALLDNPDNSAHFGLRAGLDISSTSSGGDYYNNGFGFQAGASYTLPLCKNLYVEPALMLFYDTFGLESTEEGTSSTGVPYLNTESGSIRNMGLRVPVVFGYHFDFTDDLQIAPFTGPQFNFSFMARNYWEGKSLGSCFDDGFKHFDFQWVFGVSSTYKNYYLALAESIGVTRAVSMGDGSFKRNVFSITLGYNF